MNISDGFVPIGKNEFEKKHDANAEALEKAIDEVVAKQLDLGIDVVNDGELPRENYFLHFVRKIKGIDADNLVAKTVRNGKFYVKQLPCRLFSPSDISKKISHHFLLHF